MTGPYGPSPYGRRPPPGFEQYRGPSAGRYGSAYGPPFHAPIEHPDGTTVLVMGLLGVLVCGLVAPFAWSRGNRVLRQIDASPGRYSNRSTVNAGRILGMISTIGNLIGLLIGIIGLALLVAAESGSPS